MVRDGKGQGPDAEGPLPPNLPTAVSALLETLLAGLRQALCDNVVGCYLRGSLALGDFDPETSDVDILVATERPVSEAEFEALAALHARVPARDNEFGRPYEVSYVDRASLRRFAPRERRHPTVGSDWAFGWAEHRDNFVLERWVVRERGVAMFGPDPKTLIEPISADELRAAARSELVARLSDWAKAGAREPPNWLATRYYQAFEVETVCRALQTVATGELSTKRQAVTWARATLPPEWQGLIKWSQRYRADKSPDASRFAEIVRFVHWAAAQAEARRP